MTKETIFFPIVNFPSLKVMFLCHNYTVFTFLSWFVSHAFVLMFLTFCKIIEKSYLALRVMAVMEETGMPGENHKTCCKSLTNFFTYNVVLSTLRHERDSNSQI